MTTADQSDVKPAGRAYLKLAATVDWLTATSNDLQRSPSQAVYARHLVTREVELGNPRQRSILYGYDGSMAGRATEGQRHDGLYLCARSGLADDAWLHACELGYRASRIDLAVTVWYATAHPRRALDAYNALKAYRPRAGRPPSGTYLCGTNGGATCYVGSRSSERFGRLYNKHAESGADEYQHAWRYELELKGDSARMTAEVMRGVPDWRSFIVGTVGDYFADRGIACDFRAGDESRLPDPVRRLPSDEARLAWLADGVAPAVRQLQDRIGLRTILGALGIDLSAIHDDRELDREPTRGALERARRREAESTERNLDTTEA